MRTSTTHLTLSIRTLDIILNQLGQEIAMLSLNALSATLSSTNYLQYNPNKAITNSCSNRNNSNSNNSSMSVPISNSGTALECRLAIERFSLKDLNRGSKNPDIITSDILPTNDKPYRYIPPNEREQQQPVLMLTFKSAVPFHTYDFLQQQNDNSTRNTAELKELYHPHISLQLKPLRILYSDLFVERMYYYVDDLLEYANRFMELSANTKDSTSATTIAPQNSSSLIYYDVLVDQVSLVLYSEVPSNQRHGLKVQVANITVTNKVQNNDKSVSNILLIHYLIPSLSLQTTFIYSMNSLMKPTIQSNKNKLIATSHRNFSITRFM